MVAVAQRKFYESELTETPEAATVSFARLNDLPEDAYDLVFSDFGGLNCIGPDAMAETLKQVHHRLRSGGKFIAVLMGRKCWTERLYFFLKNNRKAANRRRSNEPSVAIIDGHEVMTWYYSPFEMISLAEPALKFNKHKPIGFFIPPSYLNNKFQSLKPLATVAGKMEQMTSGFSSLSDYADHYLIEFTKP
jgi:hypothetical protein